MAAQDFALFMRRDYIALLNRSASKGHILGIVAVAFVIFVI